MYKVNEVLTLIDQAGKGELPPSGDIENVDELIGFSFGLYFDDEGQLGNPGPVNEAMAEFVVGNEVLRSKNMTLQEELAVAIEAREPRLAHQIDTLKTIKEPGTAYNTHELLVTAKPTLVQRGVGSLAVLAFRNHLPRAAAQVKKAGFIVATPDMSGVGDFDPKSPQGWIHNPEAWIRRERVAIAAFALMNRI
jgi:hypothetical protein